LNRLCMAAGLPPPLIAIDQEGGSVARLPPPFSQFSDARLLAEGSDREEKVRKYAATCARELRSVGINMNLAPVLDICPTGQGCVMERRCLGDEPPSVARLGGIIISEMQHHGLAACAKHFPGLGCVTKDPHFDLPVVTKEAEAIWQEDLLPFQTAITSNVASIMTSHTIYTALDRQNPATLSKKILTGMLKEKLGYSGIVITDDLEMGAIENNQSVADAALAAFLAGADLLLICHKTDKVIETCETLGTAIGNRTVNTTMLAASLARINRIKERFCPASDYANCQAGADSADFVARRVDFSG
ncbi:MAG: glycoside hydrolase family 3 N-terminal domain-containing protein, partial [Deltaproteobacteria bacterium]